MRTHSLKALTISVCLLLLSALPGVCAGAHEARISDVMHLIDTKDYPAALKLLADVQRAHPEQRDETERLIMRIISTQGREYNEALVQLVHVLYDEQDEKKAQQIIDTMNKLDPSRTLVDAQKSLGYVKFLKLMNAAAALLSQRKVGEAIDLYLLPLTDPAKAGFDLDKPSFDAGGYGDLVAGTARDAAARIIDQGSSARSDTSSVKRVESAFSDLLSSSATSQSLDRLNEVLSPLFILGKREQTVVSTAAMLSEMSRNLREKGGKRDSYLQYIVWLCDGRRNKPPEGLAQAIRLLWESEAAAAAEAALAAASGSWSAGAKLYGKGDFASADAQLSDAYYRGIIAVKAVSFAAAALRPSAGWGFSTEDSALLKSLLEQAVQGQQAAAQASSLRLLMSLERQAQALPSVAAGNDQTLIAFRAQAQALENDARQGQEEWTGRAAEMAGEELTGPVLDPQIAAAHDMAARFVSFAAKLEDRDLACAIALARNESGQFENRFSEAASSRAVGQDAMNGTVNGKQPAQDVFVERKPGAALKLFDAASSGLDGIETDVESLRAKWQADRAYVTANPEMKAILAGLDATESKVTAEKSEVNRLTQLALQQHENALAKRKEGDLAFADGNRALAARQFDNAKLQLGDARDLYLDSLLLEEDPGVRKRYTAEIPSLIDKINNAIVEQYIADVDLQVSSGRKAFANGEFLKSFLTLETAQARWKATLGDRPNTDLDTLLEKVRNALRVSGGRDLSPEDSRAPAVNGFVNLANAKVAQAEKLRKADPSRKRLLDDAYANVMSALDVAPVYRTAKALQLRIRKLEAKDDSAFRAEAKSEIDAIIDEYHNKKGQPERLYFALKDYQDILPDYPALRDAIQELEISLGFRIRPPSTADVANSNLAFARAQGEYDPGNSTAVQIALKDLDAAIALNPSNARAIALRRTILLRQGSPEASNLSSAGLARFAESKRLYNTEDYAGAYKILQDLVDTDKRNAAYPPLAQLYNLTQQKLGLR